MENRDMELHEKLARLQWLMRRYYMQKHARRGPVADPTRGQGRVLAMLKLQPQISTKDMSYLLGIRQQSLNELLNKLEKAGYVVRTPSEADRRVMLVGLTEKGRALEQAEHDTSDLFACLSPEEQSAFGDYLDRLIAALEGQVGAEADEEDRRGWEHAARGHMDHEMFEQMMSRHGGPGRPGHDQRDRDFFEGFDRFGADRRGHAPHGGRPCAPGNPPPPPKGPHEPDEG